jgi:hypothetical protein
VSAFPICTAASVEQFGRELTALFHKIDRIHSFDVSRLGGIGCSMFIFSFFFDQTGRFGGQRLG